MMDFAISFETFIGVVGALFGFIALFFSGSVRREMNQLRDNNTRLSNALSETNGRLAKTREDMVTRTEFNGAINRLYGKMSKIDNHMVLFLAKLSAKNENGRRVGDSYDVQQ